MEQTEERTTGAVRWRWLVVRVGEGAGAGFVQRRGGGLRRVARALEIPDAHPAHRAGREARRPSRARSSCRGPGEAETNTKVLVNTTDRLAQRLRNGGQRARQRCGAAGSGEHGDACAGARLPDVALDRLRDVIDVLRLDDGLHIVLKNARQEVLQLAAAEVCEDLLPIRRVLRQKAGRKRTAVSSQCGESKEVDGGARRCIRRGDRRSSSTAGSARTSKRPRLGLSFPAKILSAVDFPIPFVPTRPSTWPGRGVGSLRRTRGCAVSLQAGRAAANSGGKDRRSPHLCSLNVFVPYLCVVSFSRSFGRLMIIMASKGHFCGCLVGVSAAERRRNGSKQLHTLTQIPQPMQSSSESFATFDVGVTSRHSLPVGDSGRRQGEAPSSALSNAIEDAPIFTTGHDFLHSCLHFLGLHLSVETMAMRVSFSSSLPPLSSFFFGGILTAGD